jgi:hypothetical protein
VNKKLPCAAAQGSFLFNFQSGLCTTNDHIFEQYLKRHGVSASFMGKKELAITIKNTIIVGDMMFAIVAMEIKVKLIEVEAVSILCISFCLFYLAYQSRIHCINLLI